MTMYQFTCLLLVLFLLTGCSSKTETVEVKNDAGVVTEVYTRNKKDFSKEGVYKAYDSEGKITEEAIYKNNELDGVRKLYFESGALRSTETYRNGMFEGEFVSYDTAGNKSLVGKYVNNEMTGEWQRFYANGQLMEKVMFADNEENGPFIEYYENGKLKAEGKYKGGDQENGELLLYNENGELERKMDCDLGRCVTTWRSEALIQKEKEEKENESKM